ncbi:MAG TPA: VIT1/CCC1 transporter family protein [Polyangia bacterium]|nr:VIT1/CCC1 transporter family protein [Polyangia bacterium]
MVRARVERSVTAGVGSKSFRAQRHRIGRGSWLRAAVLGADDGVVSTASLVIGVASASASKGAVLVAGAAGLVAGALAMAAGEYVSVSSQRDVEEADVALERRQLREDPAGELAELTDIYLKRGLGPELARKVAEQLSSQDRLRAHLRDELGLRESLRARPLQAAGVSALSFASLAAVPLLTFAIAPVPLRSIGVALVSLAGLAALGASGAALGGGPRLRAALRVLIGGGLAMAASALIGKLLGAIGL